VVIRYCCTLTSACKVNLRKRRFTFYRKLTNMIQQLLKSEKI
jgi:hypothetical protein